MKNNTLFLFVSFLIIAFSACRQQNMGLSNSLSANILSVDYSTNIQNGNKRYKGKYITVSGEISQYYKNKYQENIIILMDKNNKYGVKCTLVKSNNQIRRPLKQGGRIVLNGRCAGFNEFVLLKGCIILKK